MSLQNYVVWAINDFRSFRCNITCIFKIACNKRAIPLYPFPPQKIKIKIKIHVPISKSFYACVCYPARYYFPFSLCFTHIATFSTGMMYSKPQKVFMFTTWESLYMDSNSLGHCKVVCGWLVSMVHTRYHPSRCGNSPMLFSWLSYPLALSHVFSVTPWGMQIAPIWRFANESTSQHLQKTLPIFQNFFHYNKHMPFPIVFC